MKFDIGCSCFDYVYGWGVVTSEYCLLETRITVEFAFHDIKDVYTKYGYFSGNCIVPSLYPHEVTVNTTEYKQSFKETEAGLKVSDPKYGNGYIIAYDVNEPKFPVVVQFDCGIVEYYSRLGFHGENDHRSCLFRGHGITYIKKE